MKSYALLTLLALFGCQSPSVPVEPPPAAPEADGIVRRAVVINLLTTSEGLDCPGTDVDADTAWVWAYRMEGTRLADGQARRSAIEAAIRKANEGMRPQDLLFIFISGHGTTRPDADGDEPSGNDSGLVLWDSIWWDDEVWRFVCTLRPCRIDLVTDTCFAEGNWRYVRRTLHYATLGLVPRSRQMEFNLGDGGAGKWREGNPALREGGNRRQEWAGQISQFAACSDHSYSYGVATGGTGTQTLNDLLQPGITRAALFAAWKKAMPRDQQPVWAVYNLSESFRKGEFLR